jgi:omega-amidase
MESTNLTVALCQYDPFWNNPLSNFSIIEELNSAIISDILFLPEMFSTGFILNPKILTDSLAIKSKKWLESYSHQQMTIGSCPILEQDKFYNRLFVYNKGKEITHYDKHHTFIGGEREAYQSGSTLNTFEFKGWKIGLNICYDLRFPVWCRAQECDIMVFCANWPSKRQDHWTTLLKARAIENQCYVIGINRIGTDENDWHYSGDSVVFDFMGKELINLKDKETCLTTTLSKLLLNEYRAELPFLEDRDDFRLNKISFNKL